MAEAQSAGRGRLPGRNWETQAGMALLVTAWFPLADLSSSADTADQRGYQPPPLSLIAGLAVAKACLAWARSEACAFKNGIAVKWPNDILCGGSKLAGLLCEVSKESIYIGMGLNCSQDSFSGGYKTQPTSILLETGQPPDRITLLGFFLRELEKLLSPRSVWLPELNQLLAWKGRNVEFRQGLATGPPLRGVLLGLASDGALLLRIGDSTECYHSGELSLVIDECRLT